MTPRPVRRFAISLSVFIISLFFSCTKPHSPGGTFPGGVIPHVPQQLQSITVQVVFRQPAIASITWTPSGDFLGDTIFYKIMLQGKTVDSNLLKLNDTLTSLLP